MNEGGSTLSRRQMSGRASFRSCLAIADVFTRLVVSVHSVSRMIVVRPHQVCFRVLFSLSSVFDIPVIIKAKSITHTYVALLPNILSK